MRCRDLSLVIVSEPGVPGGFSASLEWGRAGIISKSFARDLSRDMGCVAPLCCSVAIVWQVPTELSWAIRWETLPHLTVSYRTRSHLEVGIN